MKLRRLDGSLIAEGRSLRVLCEEQAANLLGANLQEANLQEANLQEANLQEANLLGANLQEAHLEEANLLGANLRGANLRGANLRGANLQEANLQEAHLEEAHLQEAHLEEAHLERANLLGANLQEAHLEEANLLGANLSHTEGLLDAIVWLRANFEEGVGGFVVFKAQGQTYYDSPSYWQWEEGAILEEEVNCNRTELCGCGVNFAALWWIEQEFERKKVSLWRCLLRWEDLAGLVVPYNTDGKARCRRLQLLEKVWE